MLYNRAIRNRTDLLFGSRRRMRKSPRSRRLLRIVPLEQRSLLSVSDDENNTAYTYDSVGRLATVTSQAGTTTYSYDIFGNLAKVVTTTGSIRLKKRLFGVVQTFGDFANGVKIKLADTEYRNRIDGIIGFFRRNPEHRIFLLHEFRGDLVRCHRKRSV